VVSSSSDGLIPLTRRELDILQLLAAGKSNQEIAENRVVTLNTVKKHVGNILSKMGVANRTQAVMLAKKLGWID
jgi:LuxR family maltose regulon positive regulatory protein